MDSPPAQLAWQAELDRAVDARFAQMVAVRRHLHAHPEISGEEHKTTLYLYQLLADEGFSVRMGPEGRGVVADCAPAEGPLLALRADIDALRIHDAKQVPYRSTCDGVMHACGHDAHSAAVLGALLALRDAQQAGGLPWSVPCRGIFQPAEETSEGARAMVEFGSLEGVGAILALHVDPTREVGRVGLRSGVLTASCDDMRVVITGCGGHAARPHEAIDPIAAAAQLINALYLFIPRQTDSQDAVVVTIGRIRGGELSNVIPEAVELHGTVRTLEPRVRERTVAHIRRIAEGIARTSETVIETHFGHGAPAVRNDPVVTELLRHAAVDLLGPGRVQEISRPSMGSEDFSYYLEHVPGAMFRLGCAPPGADAPLLHTPLFDIDEQALAFGSKILARAAVAWARPAR